MNRSTDKDNYVPQQQEIGRTYEEIDRVRPCHQKSTSEQVNSQEQIILLIF